MGQLGVFYRHYLRDLLGVSWSIRNEVLYVITGCGPLQIYLAKAVFCFVLHADEHPGLLGLVAAWICSLDFKRLWSRIFFGAAQEFAS